MSDYGEAFQLNPFREFYAEIIRLKSLVGKGAWDSPASGANTIANPEDAETQRGTWVYFPDVVSGEGADDVITAQTWNAQADSATALTSVEREGNGAGSAVDFPELLQPSDAFRVSTVVWHRLVALFQRQAITAWNNGGSDGAQSYRDAQYVMVVLADEIFLNMNWAGQSTWVSHLLEEKIFRSHTAGQDFFERLDDLLREQDPRQKDLAAIYLLALSLGFKGKYDDLHDRPKLARYRRQLFNLACSREPDPDDETRYVFPEAYYHNVREESQRKLSDPRQWIVVLCLVIIVYAAATQAFWIQFTRELYAVNESITQIIGALKAQP